jgi:hypothetical protein
MMGSTSLKEIRETLRRHYSKDGNPRSGHRPRATPEGRKLIRELERFIEALESEVSGKKKRRGVKKKP